MVRVGKVLVFIGLALFMLAGCDDVGPGSGGSGDELGAAEQTSGTFNLACLKITHTVNGDEVMVRLYINGWLVGYQFMSPQLTQWPFAYQHGNSSVQGTLTYEPPLPWGASLTVNIISLVCNYDTYEFTGEIAAWD